MSAVLRQQEPGATIPPAISAIIAIASRSVLEAAIERMIDRLDAIDGDADLEAFCEDDFAHATGHGPGCPISDPGGGNCEDEGEQVSEDGLSWHDPDDQRTVHNEYR
ncbi:hypothetical protein [uncultured Parasphingopyxis sp.]|uniref:hypothetical protein n=1 Tax=uncultured Parasphingopyxis sp. TaxID=1547918 RepID=UPI0026174B22|nr:hypothetical protein [uncultured Parasphingopyxis sp.]